MSSACVNKLWCHESRNPEVRLVPRNTLADFRCFKRHLFALDKLVGPVLPCGRLTSCASPRTFGCPIKLAGINMRILVIALAVCMTSSVLCKVPATFTLCLCQPCFCDAWMFLWWWLVCLGSPVFHTGLRVFRLYCE